MAKNPEKAPKTANTLPNIGDAILLPLADGRFGFCHVLHRRGRDEVFVETSSWVGDEAPSLSDPRLRRVLVQTHHGWGPNEWRVIVRGSPPDSFTRLGTIEPSGGPERVLAIWTPWQNLACEVLTQWSWDHDREALVVEEAAEGACRNAEQEQSAKRVKERLEGLTLDWLLKKRRFSGWKGDRPDRAIAACRVAFREAIEALIELGAKPKKRAVGVVVRQCIKKLNALDEQYDGFIETGEREALCREIDDIVYACGLRECDGMADRWREW